LGRTETKGLHCGSASGTERAAARHYTLSTDLSNFPERADGFSGSCNSTLHFHRVRFL